MSPTQYIVEKSGLTLLPEISDPTGQYHMFNSGGVEAEVGEFLYGLTRIVKPQVILETGTHKGISAAYFGLALKENNNGIIFTIEFDEHWWKEALNLWKKLELDRITLFKIKVEDFQPTNSQIDILLLDTEPDQRFAELVRFFPYVNSGGFILIHDLHRGMSQGNINPDRPDLPSWPFGDLPKEIKDWVKDGQLRPFHFGTPRGLTCFYKTDGRDYKWL